MRNDPAEQIHQRARELGFAACGFVKVRELKEDAGHLKEWLSEGRQAGMSYMERNFEKRTNPSLLVDGARTVISLLFNYYTDKKQEDPQAPVLSSYAYGKDYHFVMKEKLFLLFDYIRELIPGSGGRVFVDSAPVLDRAWAREAGLGWIGKNSMLINRTYGSFVFIGEIILDHDLEPEPVVPEADFCGSCTRCIEACPTGAILTDRSLDSKLCLSYQTIENRDEIPNDLVAGMSNRVFGCDICQEVCPWNRKAIQHKVADFEAAEGLLSMSQEDWQAMDRASYKELFRDSAVERAGFKKLRATLDLLKK